MLIVPFPLMGKEPKDQGRLHRTSQRLSKRLTLSFLLLDEKEPKNQGQNHRPSARPPKRLTFKSGSDFCKVKRKRPSLKVKRLVVPWATAPPRFGRAHAPNPVEVWRTRPRCPLFSLSFLTTHSRPWSHCGLDPQIEDST